jgi:hypothetical protein
MNLVVLDIHGERQIVLSDQTAHAPTPAPSPTAAPAIARTPEA